MCESKALTENFLRLELLIVEIVLIALITTSFECFIITEEQLEPDPRLALLCGVWIWDYNFMTH